MSGAADIEFLPGSNRYQLILPSQVTSVLDLMDAEGKTLPITHENKMQLEWLGQKLLSMSNKLTDRLITKKAILKRKKAWALSILIITVIAGLFNYNLAHLIHVNHLQIEITAFAVGVIACLQLLKYFALGFTEIRRDFSSDLQFSELKELIRKDYSLE